MYNDVGKKLKRIADGSCVLGIFFCVVAGFIMIVALQSVAGFVIGICVAIGGSVAAWYGSILTYAFGELVDKTASTYDTSCKVLRALEELQQTQEQVNATVDSGNADITPESSTSTTARRRRQLPPI